MSGSTFERRMQHLKEAAYPVIDLRTGLQGLSTGKLPSAATVITIDDGWYSTLETLVPVVEKFDYPTTLYLSTYYMESQTQVFNVAIDYVLWRSEEMNIDLEGISDSLEGRHAISSDATRSSVTRLLWDVANSLESAEAREELLESVARKARVSLEPIRQSRAMSYVTKEEVFRLKEYGVDVQLHTHRHRFPADSFEATRREIEDNRRSIEGIIGGERNHFCYPSGEYELRQLSWMKELGIISATTVNSGHNSPGDDFLELGRFLDAEQITDIEFEAEMAGVNECLRKVRRVLSGSRLRTQ